MNIATDMERQKLIILTAPSGAGKTTIANELIRQLPQLALTISVTTRKPRAGEIEGQNYYFVSVDEFKEKISQNAFLEYEKVYEGKYYGTLYSELQRIWEKQQYPIRIVDVKGADNLNKKFGKQALSIFIKPPSFDILKQRLTQRAAESKDDIQERLNRVAEEMNYEHSFDQVVINDNLEPAITRTMNLVRTFIEA